LPRLGRYPVYASPSKDGRITSVPFGELLIERVADREKNPGRLWFANESSDTFIKRGTIDEDVGL
jgi:hypothetical protein